MSSSQKKSTTMVRSGIQKKVACLFTAALLLIGLTGCCPPFCPPNGGVEKPFVLAYVDTNWQLRIRLSNDGTSWGSASGGTPSIDRGPGIAANEAGTIYLAVFEDTVSKARMMTGAGPRAWDSAPTTIGNGHAGEIDSGASIVHVDGLNWLVAFAHQNRAKVVKLDSSPSVRDFGAEVTPVPGVVNSNLIDRPAMVNRNGRLIVSWLMSDNLQMVTGDIQGGQPVWQSGYLFDANFSEQGYGPPVGAHDLAHDGQDFYAAVVRRREPLPGESAIHYFIFIYTSNNGLNWTKLTYTEILKIPHSMSIAARGTNNIIALISYAYSGSSGTKAYRFNGSSWTYPNTNAFFGSHQINHGHDFTLFALD